MITSSEELSLDEYQSLYWNKQPMKLIENNNEIEPINKNPIEEIITELPTNFYFKELDLTYLDEIEALLNNNYVEDASHSFRLIYHRDFLYWYLKYVPKGFILGLIYKKKLVGLITAAFFDMMIYQNKLKIPYINFLCLHNKLRNLRLAPIMIDKIKTKIFEAGYNSAFFTSMIYLNNPFCITKEYAIPINHSKLKKIKFICEDLEPLSIIDNNPLHLMKKSDINSVVNGLNKFMEKYDVKPYFIQDSVSYLLLPKKNIVYSFVRRDENDQVTDFISVYHNYCYCIKKNIYVSIVELAFYFHSTLTLSQLIVYLLDKLTHYQVDQLILRNFADNITIDYTKYQTQGQLYYYLFNVAMKQTKPHQIITFPF